MNILTFPSILPFPDELHPMWTRTKGSLPPKHEILAVTRLLSKSGETVDELAIWNGELWTRILPNLVPDTATFDLYEIRAWRRLET